LSYLCLEALRRTGLVYPTVGVCWHEGTPADLTRLASEIVADGCANPAFFGDETIQRGLRSYGVPAEESGNYINSTCVEITPVSSSNVWVASPYFSTCGILREEVAAQAASDAPVRDFSSFLACYRDRLGQRIADAAKAQASLREGREKHGRKPLQSVFTKDCIARGRDIDDGGARYNWVECSFVGLANLVDSLWVVRQEIYEQKVLDFPELMRILDADFAGEEPVRRRFLSYPKYGNAVGEIDTLFDEIVTFARGECARHPMPPDKAHFVPGAFCWVMHERLGSQCGATPDGRRAGTPFADGCGPAQGREACGPTAAVLSTTSWDHAPLIGGSAFNMKFNKSLFADQGGRERLGDLVLTFLRRGGFETQINVVDADRLLAAREHPEDYRDLVVRIGGYTDYFVRLSPGMQDEVIRRTQFATV
jgi:formate C-acetyltransferase